MKRVQTRNGSRLGCKTRTRSRNKRSCGHRNLLHLMLHLQCSPRPKLMHQRRRLLPTCPRPLAELAFQCSQLMVADLDAFSSHANRRTLRLMRCSWHGNILRCNNDWKKFVNDAVNQSSQRPTRNEKAMMQTQHLENCHRRKQARGTSNQVSQVALAMVQSQALALLASRREESKERPSSQASVKCRPSSQGSDEHRPSSKQLSSMSQLHQSMRSVDLEPV
jgi:hypothetical protein